ncbi:MAG: fructose 1,6-bisphosphatase [Deltaproteobacteria bacterium]|nr:fructose 1,6-bisphosphatase [Deltaproteobacteria bacterium]
MKVTLSVIKADIGGYVGHSSSHPKILEAAKESLSDAKEKDIIIDYYVTRCGDDLELIMTHNRGTEDDEIHGLAWDTFVKCTELAKELKLYGAGQDLLSDAFSGNIRGMGPGFAEMEFEERKSEPVIIFMADKTSPGAWNLPLFKIFADPFNTIGLVIDPTMHKGFTFQVLDVYEDKRYTLSCPEDMYDLLALIGATGKYVIQSIYKKGSNDIVAVASTQKLGLMAGKYVGKDDPVLIVRSQSGFPAIGEILEPFSFPHLVEGWMRGSHNGPLMPVRFDEANPARFDGPPRVIAAGFQISNGRLIGPRDMFDDPSFDEARRKANEMANYMRSHGPFQPHRLSLSDMEYTTLPKVMDIIVKELKFEIPRELDLERAIKDRYKVLRDIRVVVPDGKSFDRVLKVLAKEGAMYFEQVAKDGASIGLGCGRTIASLISNLQPGRFSKLKIYPLSITPMMKVAGLSSNVLVEQMVAKYPDAAAFNLPSIPVSSKEEYEKEYLKIPEVKEIYEKSQDVDIFLVGIGSIELETPGFAQLAYLHGGITPEVLKERGVVAEINMAPIYEDGEPLLEVAEGDLKDLARRVVGVSLSRLREMAKTEGKWVIAVAGGEEKVEAIRAALKGGYFNVLITDSFVAHELLK